MKLRRWLVGGALALVIALGVLVGSASSRAEEVSILMPSSFTDASADLVLSLIHISEPTRPC